MVENTCRDMVLYRPIYGPGEDWDLPELIPLADWDKHVAHKISILAYDPSLPYVPYVACDSSLIKKAHGYGEADAAGSASTNDLLKGEAYVDIDYLLLPIRLPVPVSSSGTAAGKIVNQSRT
ncbi:hypothetical protein C8F04DRAFT_1252625 [Mycena alexandri]|uniref:Uncharacterized protein n=1 Tax=Mycena alexandri TaxID=1745969 RepID=A0AAD6TA72_9AGAR|nr:hypothetical protein C8F04DRAFT_1252625 [Mycena alexandri]